MEAQKTAVQDTKALICWSFFDWANSSFSSIIETFVFPAFFIHSFAANPTLGSAMWGWANGAAAFIIALSAPVLGAIADQGKRRKPWIAFFTFLCIAATALLGFLPPQEKNVWTALALVSLASIGSEISYVFYNAMLADLASKEDIGRWSGWGWGFGYVGGMLSLFTALFFFFESDVAGHKINHSVGGDVQGTVLLCAGWYFVFSLPLFLYTPDMAKVSTPVSVLVRSGLKQLFQTLKNIGHYGSLARFFLARMFYIDGLTTLFVFGGIYASTVFGMQEKDILIFGIALNVSAGIGAGLFALLDDRIGGKNLILLSLSALLALTLLLLLAIDIKWFWVLGLALGIFVGPVQSASRSYLSRLASEQLRNEMFGFFTLSGKATAFLGPTLAGWLIFITGSNKMAMSVIAIFYAVGLLLMLSVPSDTKGESLAE